MTGRAGSIDACDRGAAFAALWGLAFLALWELLGWDLPIARWFGSASGFPLKDAWWTEGVMHQGGRALAYGVMAFMAVDAAFTLVRGPSRGEKLWWLAVSIVCMIVVPAIKRASTTSCPWDLAEFGGSVGHVPHWLLGVTDGGPGRCFPSGHAVAAFGYFGLWFLWRGTRPVLARVSLVAVIAFGVIFGIGQLARGAHFPSHTMWSAWLCWVFFLAASVARQNRPRIAESPEVRGVPLA